MNQKTKIILVGMGIATVVIGLLFTQPALQDGSSEEESADSSQFLEENNKKVKELYKSPREAIRVESKELSPECAAFWSSLRGFDLRSLPKDIKDLKEKTLSAKCASVPPALKAVHDYFNEACQSGSKTTNCLIAVYHYRAAMTDFLTKDIPVSKISDARTLLDKILSNREINPELSIQAAERLAEVDPSLYEARKAQVLGRLFLATKRSEQSGNSWNDLDDSIQRAREFGKFDPELLEAELYSEIARSASWERAIEKSQEVSEEFPQEWRGPYFAAWALFKEGRGQEALDYLMEAQKREPNNSRVRLAIEGIKKGDANPFQANISYNDLSQYD